MFKSNLKHWLVLLIAGLFLSVIAFPALAGGQIATHVIDGKAAMAADTYWTKERMANAKPYPLPALANQPQTSQGKLQEPLVGAPGLVKGGLPQSMAAAPEGATMLAPSPFSLPTPLQELIYPPPQTTFNALTTLYGTASSVFPYIAIGKVYFTQSGSNWVASGASIGGRAILTAGHVTSDGAGNWSTNVIFKPSLRDSTAPYGSWTYTQLFTFNGWFYDGDFSRDVGCILVANQGGLMI